MTKNFKWPVDLARIIWTNRSELRAGTRPDPLQSIRPHCDPIARRRQGSYLGMLTCVRGQNL